MLDTSGNHTDYDEKFIKARWSPQICSSSSELENGGIATAGRMPAPKVWQRTSGKATKYLMGNDNLAEQREMLVTGHHVLDEELIKKRSHRRNISSIPSGLAPGETCMPAPKVWQRTSKKKQVTVTHGVIPTNRSTGSDPNNDIAFLGPSSESAPAVLDEWSRDFLFVVGLNEH
jgi:hypothetical protein